MTDRQISQALALGRCTFSPGSTAKRFVRWVSGIAKSEPDRKMSKGSGEMLERLAHSYREQLGGCMATDCKRCAPADQLALIGAAPFEPPPSRPSTAERFAAAEIERGWCARFIALRRAGYQRDDDGMPVVVEPRHVEPVGGKQPSTFKTLRNARQAAGNDGFVLVFDPSRLPLVADEATHDSVDFGQRLDDEAFAERQLLYWERELAAIRAKKPVMG